MRRVLLLYEDNLNLKDFNIGVITNMEGNISKQEPKVRWTKLLKPTFKTKANKAKTRIALTPDW